MARKYALDTNLFVYGFRDQAVAERLSQFHQLHAPFEYLSSIVEQELLAGTKDESSATTLKKQLLSKFEQLGRVFHPSAVSWRRCGLVLAEMSRKENIRIVDMSKSFVNDVLLALSCRESGITLVTANEKDFKRIKPYITGFMFTTSLP